MLTDEELSELKNEMFHYKLKIAELNALIDQHQTLTEHGESFDPQFHP